MLSKDIDTGNNDNGTELVPLTPREYVGGASLHKLFVQFWAH